MSNIELAHPDITEWVASLLPPELWNRYCYLSFAQMADIPELAEYADDLRQAEREWYCAYKNRGIEAIPTLWDDITVSVQSSNEVLTT